MAEIERASERDAGCWIDGVWGQYGMACLIEIAYGLGWENDEAVDIADRHLASMGPSGEDDIYEHEILSSAADDAESWLNDHVAPEGFAFGWHDGEFFLSRIESIGDGTSWEEAE